MYTIMEFGAEGVCGIYFGGFVYIWHSDLMCNTGCDILHSTCICYASALVSVLSRVICPTPQGIPRNCVCNVSFSFHVVYVTVQQADIGLCQSLCILRDEKSCIEFHPRPLH